MTNQLTDTDKKVSKLTMITDAEIIRLQDENARLREAVADLRELGRDVKAELDKLWSPNDQSQVRRDYRMITETLNEIDAMLEEVVD